jgi:membrane associated rhomboid family serine protease
MFLPLKDDNPTSRVPVFTLLLIAVNVAVFFSQALSPQGLEFHVVRMGAIPYELTHFTTLRGLPRLAPPLTLLTSMFVHGGLFHLLGNMLYLWIFGNNIEDYLGKVRFVLFYLLAGLGASATHVIFHPNSQLPMVGASGAIAGILGAYLVLYPRARVLTLVLFWIVPVPATLLLILWFLGQVMNVGLGGGVAWFAHIGGFLIGVLLISRSRQKRPPAPFVTRS